MLLKVEQDMAVEQRLRHEQSQFLHMLMHELKTPLSIVAVALGTKAHRQENLEHAGRAIQDMKAIIERCVHVDQLEYAEPNTNPAPYQQTVRLADLIKELADATPLLSERLQLTADPALPDLATDQQLLHIILHNLLDNAARYSDPLTPILVSVQAETKIDQAGFNVCIANTPGMAGWPEETKVFNKYYRSNGAQRESGSGLGLYLALQLASSLGGTLRYAPSSQYVEFHLWLPLPSN